MSRLMIVLCAAFALCAGCRSPAQGYRTEVVDPDARLRELWDLYTAGEHSLNARRGEVVFDHARVVNELRRLSLEFPGHVPSRFANAVVAWKAGEFDRAGGYLDEMLRLQPVHPDAAVLRARVSIAQGNLDGAERLLERQIDLSPDHAGLHEALAKTRFLRGDDAGTLEELELAGRLGAPRWRIAFHRGLLAERAGDLATARARYEEALEANPGVARARSRLDGLRARLGEVVRPPADVPPAPAAPADVPSSEDEPAFEFELFDEEEHP